MKGFIFRTILAVLGLGILMQAQVHPVQRVRVSQGFAETLVVRKVQPVYPTEARKKHIEGKVVMQAEISKGGVEFLKVLSGDPLLAPAATTAVKKMEVQTISTQRRTHRNGNTSHGELYAR